MTMACVVFLVFCCDDTKPCSLAGFCINFHVKVVLFWDDLRMFPFGHLDTLTSGGMDT